VGLMVTKKKGIDEVIESMIDYNAANNVIWLKQFEINQHFNRSNQMLFVIAALSWIISFCAIVVT
jgi:hypothetical protein